jgi:hypothetical protein
MDVVFLFTWHKEYLILSANPASINDYSGMQDVGLNKKSLALHK